MGRDKDERRDGEPVRDTIARLANPPTDLRQEDETRENLGGVRCQECGGLVFGVGLGVTTDAPEVAAGGVPICCAEVDLGGVVSSAVGCCCCECRGALRWRAEKMRREDEAREDLRGGVIRDRTRGRWHFSSGSVRDGRNAWRKMNEAQRREFLGWIVRESDVFPIPIPCKVYCGTD